jgi:YVTN family beta-propeller protein
MRRKKRFVVAIGALALCAMLPSLGEASDEGAPVDGTVWVTGRALNSVTAFDAATGQVLGQESVGMMPIGVAQPLGTGKAYTSDESSNQLSVLDAETVKVIDTIPMGLRPHHMVPSTDGRYVFVGEYGQNTVGIVDTQTDERIAGCAASNHAVARTHAVWATRNGRHLWATNEVTNDIAAIKFNPNSRRICRLRFNVPIGDRPSEILVTPNEKTAYVSVRNENKVKVVDLTSRQIVGEAEIGTMPDTLQLTPDRKTLIVTLRGTPAQISFMDTQTLAVETLTISPGTTTGHHWLSSGGRYTYVAVENPNSGYLAVIDNHTRTVVAGYDYPGDETRPHGVFFTPAPCEGLECTPDSQ